MSRAATDGEEAAVTAKAWKPQRPFLLLFDSRDFRASGKPLRSPRLPDSRSLEWRPLIKRA